MSFSFKTQVQFCPHSHTLQKLPNFIKILDRRTYLCLSATLLQPPHILNQFRNEKTLYISRHVAWLTQKLSKGIPFFILCPAITSSNREKVTGWGFSPHSLEFTNDSQSPLTYWAWYWLPSLYIVGFLGVFCSSPSWFPQIPREPRLTVWEPLHSSVKQAWFLGSGELVCFSWQLPLCFGNVGTGGIAGEELATQNEQINNKANDLPG